MMLAVVCFLWGNVWALIGVLFLMGSQSSIFGPLKYAILPQHLPPEELTAGNAFVQMGTFLAILLGTMLGGFVMALDRIGVGIVCVIVIGLAILGWAASREIPPAAPPKPDLEFRWNFLAHTYRILGYAREDRLIFASVLGIAWFWFVGFTFLQLLPAFTRDVLGGGPQVVTFMLTAFSIGIGLGSVLCAIVSRGKIEPRLVIFGGIGLAVFSTSVYFLSRVPALDATRALSLAEFVAGSANWWIFADLVLISVSGGLYVVPLVTLIQHRASVVRRAQIIAASNVMNACDDSACLLRLGQTDKICS